MKRVVDRLSTLNNRMIPIRHDIPEDTDVFHVLSRKPSVAEWIATQKYVYRIEPDGTINYVMTVEAFRKMGK